MLAKFPNWIEVVDAVINVFLCLFLSVSVRQLHREFLRAGSDVMQTFTFYASDDKLENRGNTQRFTVSECTIFTPSCGCSCSRNVIFTSLSWGAGNGSSKMSLGFRSGLQLATCMKTHGVVAAERGWNSETEVVGEFLQMASAFLVVKSNC